MNARRLWTAGFAVVVMLAVAGCAPSTPVAAAYPVAGVAETTDPVPAQDAPAARALDPAGAIDPDQTVAPTEAVDPTQEVDPAPAAKPTPTGSAGKRQTGSAAADAVDPNCTKATKVQITSTPGAGGSPYSFSPRLLTIKRGGFLAVTNASGTALAFRFTPAAGNVTSVLARQERQVIQFPKRGTFTLRSTTAAHRGLLRITVAGESGCGATKRTLTLAKGNAITPALLTVVATENFAVVNLSGSPQAVSCTPDPGGNRDNSRLARGETQLLAIDKPGRYRCGSVQHPSARAIIQVK